MARISAPLRIHPVRTFDASHFLLLMFQAAVVGAIALVFVMAIANTVFGVPTQAPQGYPPPY